MMSAACFHDWTNVVMLSFIFALSLVSLRLGEDSVGHTAVICVTFVYLVADIIWITFQPGMVKTPMSIIAHHLVTLIVMFDTLEIPAHRANASRALLVEINTVLLTLRRLLGHPLWCEIGFYASWVLVRLIWFPLLGGALLASTLSWGEDLDNALSPFLAGPLLGLLRPPKVQLPPVRAYASLAFAAVVLLQFYWTLTLGRGLLSGKAREVPTVRDGKPAATPSSGAPSQPQARLLITLLFVLTSMAISGAMAPFFHGHGLASSSEL